MRNRRTWGYIADISKNNSDNTTTPYQLTVVARVVYLREGEREFSYVWARVPTFTSNCLTTSDVTLQEGTPVFGILMPTFGNFVNATFATWEVGTLSMWRAEGLGPPLQTSEIDLDPWSWAPLPSLGASGFYTKKQAPRITGVRIKPPMIDVHEWVAKTSKNFREPTPYFSLPSSSLNLHLPGGLTTG